MFNGALWTTVALFMLVILRLIYLLFISDRQSAVIDCCWTRGLRRFVGSCWMFLCVLEWWLFLLYEDSITSVLETS